MGKKEVIDEIVNNPEVNYINIFIGSREKHYNLEPKMYEFEVTEDRLKASHKITSSEYYIFLDNISSIDVQK